MVAKPDQPIRSFSVKNFGCLKDVSLEFEPFTVLVGPNDCGKTMVFRALETLALASSEKNGWMSVYKNRDAFKTSTFGGNGRELSFDIIGNLSGKTFTYSVSLQHRAHTEISKEVLRVFNGKSQLFSSLRTSNGSWEVRKESQGITTKFGQLNLPILHTNMIQSIAQQPERGGFLPIDDLQDLTSIVSSLKRMSLIPDRLRASVPVKHEPIIRTDGFGLSRAYVKLALQNRDARDHVEVALRHAFNHIDRVDIQQVGDNYSLELVTKQSFRIPADRVSDGMLIVFAYLLMSFGEAPSPVLLIEEPENGIHQGLISQVVDSLRKLAHGELGERPVQVIAATQSPILLNYVEPSEIRVLRRGEDGATLVTDFENAPELAELLEYQSPGEIWVNLGEDYIAGSKHEWVKNCTFGLRALPTRRKWQLRTMTQPTIAAC